ncbi:MAG: T9SS type A sorting domain-containing protein [Saprospiraceae bacterium]|nr:T9SS type A sorting domain-containing protein [Candidatus Vicinibacter affinis]
MNRLILLLLLGLTFNKLSGQPLLIDSSFGINGSVIKTVSGGFNINAFGNLIFDQQKNIFWFYKDLLFYLDSNGIFRAGLGKPNPDSLRTKTLRFAGVSDVSDSSIFLTYSKDFKTGYNYYVRKINKYDLLDSSFGDKGLLKLDSNVLWNFGQGIKNDNSYLIAYYGDRKLTDPIKMTILNITQEGSINSKTIYLPDTCTNAVLNLAYFTDLIADSKGNTYFGIEYSCSPIHKIYVVKLKPDLDLDQSFGKGGVLEIYYEEYDQGSTKLGLQSLLIGNQNEIYLIMKSYLDEHNIIRKLYVDGSYDVNYGDAGKFELLEYSDNSRIFPYFNPQTNEILFFGYDAAEMKSKLLAVNSSGQLNAAYDLNGGLKLDGIVNDFKPFGAGSYMVSAASTIPYDRTSYLFKLKPNVISSSVDPVTDDDVTFNFNCTDKRLNIENKNGLIKHIRIYNLLGQGLLTVDQTNQPEITVDLGNLVAGEYILQILDRSERNHVYLFANY